VRYTDGRDDPKTRVGGRLGLGAFVTPGAFTGDTVVIVEGPADALSLALCGVPAVALHRTSAPDWVIKKCAFKRVLVALDADAAGDEKSPILSDAVAAYGATPARLRPPAGKDWNDALGEWGVDRLRAWLFVRLVADSWKRARARSLTWPVHDALEAAIVTSDWPAYQRELPRYERGAVLPGDYCPSCRTAMTGRQCWTCDYSICSVCNERTEYATHPAHPTCTAPLPTDAPAVPASIQGELMS
jgi:hypothetical protein